MNHFSQFKQNRKQKQSIAAASSTNLSNSNIKELEAPNLEEGHNAIELCLQRFSIFNQQDYENGHFDVTFLFGEKELFAHSFVLWSASEVFETMLFGAWAKNEPIPITGHSYNDFKEFLTFLYLGKCSLDVENVMAIVDLAEFYNVQLLKDKCDQFLTNTSPTPENVFKIVETLKTYSLENALENVFEYITINAEILLKNDSFLEVKKDIVVDIVKLERLVIKEEDLFDSIHKWALFQYQKQETVNPVWIKEELLDILPFIRFPVMNVEFLHNNVVPLGHLFSSFQELSFILRDADAVQKNTLQEPASKYRHTIRKNIRGNIARTYLPDIKLIEKFDQTSHIIKVSNGTLKECFWEIDIPKRATKNILFDLNACQIYMIRNSQGKLALKNFSNEISLNESTNQHMVFHIRNGRQFQNAYNNQLRNDENDFDECDILSRVHLDNKNFVIGSRCDLKLI